MQKKCRIETIEIEDNGSVHISSTGFKSNDGVVGNLCDVIVSAIKDMHKELWNIQLTNEDCVRLHKIHSELMEKYAVVNLKGPIKKLEANTFNNMKKLEGVAIPKSVTEISAYAFNNCWPKVVCVEKDSAAERFFLNKEYITKNPDGTDHGADLPDVKIFYDLKEYDDLIRVRTGLDKEISYSTMLSWTLIITVVFPLFPIIKFSRIFAHNEVFKIKSMINEHKNDKLSYFNMFDLKAFYSLPVPAVTIILLVYRGHKIHDHNKTVDELNRRKKILSQVLKQNQGQEKNKNKDDQQAK